MKDYEVRLLFMRIGNRYNAFAWDDFKVADWADLLTGVTLEQAEANLRRYTLNPENDFPPHPGVLAAKPVQQAEGRSIPSAVETRLMFAEQDEINKLALPAPVPDSARERMIALGYTPPIANDKGRRARAEEPGS